MYDREALNNLTIDYPRLNDQHLNLTSSTSPRYNCAAFALLREEFWRHENHENFFWVECFVNNSDRYKRDTYYNRTIYYWPPQLPKDNSLNSYFQFYEIHGFEHCEDGIWEEGVQKIALYSLKDGRFDHAIRQIFPHIWKSKMGHSVDFEHSLQGISFKLHGGLLTPHFMKRSNENPITLIEEGFFRP